MGELPYDSEETDNSEGNGDSEQTESENVAYGKYTAYFSKDATEANIEIIAGVPYSTVSHIMEDGTEVLDSKKLHKYDAAFYSKIKVGHVEAGLRTYDKYSPNHLLIQ